MVSDINDDASEYNNKPSKVHNKKRGFEAIKPKYLDFDLKTGKPTLDNS